MHEIHKGGPTEEKPYICHTCDRPACVNSDHLFAGSHQDNIQDAADKGRVPTPQAGQSGEDHHSAKMTADKVVRLREMYASGEYTQTELANRFGIGAAQASSIIRGVYWEDAGGPIKD
jgi:hypothetical protein